MKATATTFCTVNKLQSADVSFHLLPNEATEPERRVLWLQVIRREGKDGKLWSRDHPYSLPEVDNALNHIINSSH